MNVERTGIEKAPRALGNELRSIDWYNFSVARRSGRRIRSIVTRSGIGVAVGLLFYAVGWTVGGSVVIAIALAVGAVSIGSPRAGHAIDRFLAIVGEWLGLAVSWLFLAPLFLIGFTLVRAWMWLTRSDPLQLSPTPRPTYWLDADRHERKVRHAAAMFATETISHRRLGLRAVAALVLGTVVISEALLRLWGFGTPVLYVADPQAGYYPAPHQSVGRFGAHVETNAFGMRSPDYAAAKPLGVFRILMVGDSTLYGGSYIDQPELYSRQLESQLRSLANGRRVEVMAIAANGWGPFHELGYVRKFGTFGADLVMVNLPTADLYRRLSSLNETPFHSDAQPPRLALEELTTHLAWRYRTQQIGPPPAQEVEWHRTRGLAAYAELARMLRSSGAEVMFQVQPNRAAGMGDLPAQEAQDARDLAAAVRPHASFDFAAGRFRASRGRIYHDDGHLDVDGHALYARYLRDRVARSSRSWHNWLAAPSDHARQELRR
jgi:hypothetical protein